jgi:hypothetical protein
VAGGAGAAGAPADRDDGRAECDPLHPAMTIAINITQLIDRASN